ncbi:MAG TPA: histidine phosphatase family protein [Actinomycetota bacterium]|nr:histidine phosphatase family protein [Actinomycetota bacterium]
MSRRAIVLVRHGETEWSRAHRHTGRTDVPLTAAGRAQAEALCGALAARRFAVVLTSPLLRARQTCELAGFASEAVVERRLVEWDYGDYEGRTTADIRTEVEGWTVWTHGAPSGETAADVGARVDRVLDDLRARDGDALVFAHGHVLRVLAARWIGQPPTFGRSLRLDTATLSELGYERETPVILRWNQTPP